MRRFLRLFLLNINYLQCQNTLKTVRKYSIDFEHPTLQGVTNERALPQGAASLALGYVLLPFQGVHYQLYLRVSLYTFATRIMSAKTPAAVTAAPAPYPLISMGYSW